MIYRLRGVESICLFLSTKECAISQCLGTQERVKKMGADLSTELSSSAAAQDAGAAWFAVPLKPREQPVVDAHVVQALCIPADVPNELELLQVRH